MGASERAVAYLCLATLLLVATSVRREMRHLSRFAGGGKDYVRAGAVGLSAVGLLGWPLLWARLVGGAADDPVLVACMLWVVVLGAMDMEALVRGEVPRTGTAESIYNPSLSGQASGLVGVAFSIGAMLHGVSNPSRPSRPIILVALVICVALVIPQPITALREDRQQLAHAAQKVGFNYSVGLITTGIAIAVQNQNRLASGGDGAGR